MLKLLLGKTFNLEAVPVATATAANGAVLITMKAANGAMFEVTFTPHKSRPTECIFEVRKGSEDDAEWNPIG